MLSVSEAQEQILESLSGATDSNTETVALNKLTGRILAQDIVSSINIPPADNSAMDGYAVNTQDIIKKDISLSISQRIAAGYVPSPLAPGTAARIFTGAQIPEHANAVVIQENTQLDEATNQVTIHNIPQPNENIRPRGQDIKHGVCILKKGTRLDARHLGVIAAIGLDKAVVQKPIRVALLSTGDELIQPGEKSTEGKIYNSNQFMIRDLIQRQGCSLTTIDTLPDDLEQTKTSLARVSDNVDVIISIGGVSVGGEDHVKDAVSALGEIALWKVKMKPGKPLAFGKIKNAQFIGLPGNPVSSFVSFMVIAAPMLRKMQGQDPAVLDPIKLPILFDHERPLTRPEFMRVHISYQGVTKLSNQSSGVLSSLINSDGLALIPENTVLKKGDIVSVYPYKGLID